MTAARQIAEWASALRFDDIPITVRNIARRCLVDTLGVAIAGCATDPARRARSVILEGATSGLSTVLGSSRRAAAPAAAFSNATAAHALDFDDNCYAGVVHGSAVVLPAALAIGEQSHASGASLLTAFVAGSEAEYAVGQACTMSLYERGWYNTAVLGPIGAAIAAAHLLKLDAEATAAALGTAIAGTGGTKACFATDAKPILCGRAAEAGVMAALLARAGATGPADALEHRRGFAHLFNGETFDLRSIADLGRHWNLLVPGIDVKRIPICLSSHAAVEALIAAMATHGLSAEDIEAIECDTTPIVIANLAHPIPATPQEAQFSLNFAFACVLVFGDIRLEHLAGGILRDERIHHWMARVQTTTSERWTDAQRVEAPEGAVVKILTRDGRRVEHFCAAARGAAAHPLSDDELKAKFLACASRAMRREHTGILAKRLARLEHISHIGAMFDDIEIIDTPPT